MQVERYIAVADLGTSKLALSVAKVVGDDVQVIYYKERPSDGVSYSCVYNPKRAAVPLKAAIQEAEEELSIKILQLVVGLPRYDVHQEVGTAEIERTTPSSCISKDEIKTLKALAIDSYEIDDQTREMIYGAVAQSFSADDDLVCASEEDVVGVTANVISGNFKIFVGPQKPVANLDIVLNEVGVAPAKKLFVPNTVANAVLTDAEKENGVALIEIGAGVSSLTIYKGRILRHYSAIPFGGKSITTDIKCECGFTEKLAENIKLAFGACLPEKLLSMSEKVIQINDNENGSYEHLPVKYLSEVINCRAKEIIEALLYQIQDSGYADKLRNGIVITGGGADLVNISTLIKEMSGYNVRIGFPRNQHYRSTIGFSLGETSISATIGMILEAKKDPRLNCIEEKFIEKTQEEEADVEVAGEEDGSTALIVEELFPEEEVIVPINKKKPKKPAKQTGTRPQIRWIGKLKQTLTNVGEKTFDSTIGSLYDEMDNNNN